MKRNFGFSLLELMMGLFVSSLLAALLFSIYGHIRISYQLNEDVLEKVMEVKWVGDILTQHIRSAGYAPCFGVDKIITVDRRKNDAVLKSVLLDRNPYLQLVINRMNDRYYTIQGQPAGNTFLLPRSSLLDPDHSILIADCHHAEVQTIQHIDIVQNNQQIVLDKPLLYTYHDPIYVGEWIEERWFMRDGAENKSSLYQQIHKREEISSVIQTFDAKTFMSNDHLKVEFVLGTDQSSSWKFIAVVRNA